MHTRKHSVLSRLLATLLAVVTMIGIVGYVPEARAVKSASSKITLFSQSGSNSAVSLLELGNGSTKMKYSGCGIYSLMHIIQWCTNNGSGKKLTMDEGVALAKEMIAISPYPWKVDTPYNAYSKVLSEHGVKTVNEPSNMESLKAHFNKSGAIFLHESRWGKESGHYIIAVGYDMHDIDGDGESDFLIQIVDSAVNSSASRYKYAGIKAYKLDSYASIGDGWYGAGQYLISYDSYKKHGMRKGFLPNGNSYERDYSTVDNLARTGISIKPASGEDQCYIKEKPFEDSNDKAPSVPKGDTVKIVGAVKNKHGNIWYKTEDGGFVYSGDIIFFQDYFSISAKFKNTEKRSARKYPFEDSDAVKKIGKNDIVQVSKFVLNSYGNIWAQLTDGSYLCFYDKNSGENKLKFSAHVTQPTHSTTYPQGNIKVTSNYGFLFKGDVKAEVPFLSLTARVIDRETEQDVSATGSPCTLKPAVSTRTINLEKTKIDGKTMDSIVLIRKLNGSSGWYRYELNAQFGFTYEGKTFKFGNEYNLVSSNFSVGKAGETEPNFSTDPFDQFSSLFTLSAKFKNTEKRSSHEAPYLDSPKVKTIGKGDIVEVTEFVTNSHGNVWAKLTDGSYLCFYDQETGENKMKFSAHVTEPSHSTTYPEGDIKVTANYGFLFKGDVKAEVPFLSLTARVIDRETEQDVSATGSPCTLKPGSGLRTINLEKTKIDGKTMDNIVLIRKLNGSSGWYRYELNAQFGFTYEGKTFKFGNEYNFVSSNFTVGNPGELEPAPTPEPPGGEEEPPAGDEGGRVPGDANEDGAANTADALMIMQYISGFDVHPNMLNADCNGDGAVNTADALRIMQYISGFDVELV